MNARVLQVNARSVVIELLGDRQYETDTYNIVVNGKVTRKDNKMVPVISGLYPDSGYQICFEWENGQSVNLDVCTKTEFVTLNVKSFGAKGDGAADDTGAIQAAIMSCPPKGRVFIPEGTYCIRNLFLKDNLMLELGKGSLLKACLTRDAYPVFPGILQDRQGVSEYNLGTWEGNPLDTMVSVLTGINVENVTICGEGIIDGGGNFDTWWVPDINRIPPFRPRLIFLNRCRNIVIHGITLCNSPSWNIHPYFCKNVRIYGIRLESPDNSHNTDGINPESCEDVEIAGVHFSVGDDCIALKSGKIYMGRKYKQPSQRIQIRHCLMERGHGAVTIGSEIAGGVRDVLVSKCIFINTDRGLRIKTRRGRGEASIINEIRCSNIVMKGVKAPFVVNCYYDCDPDGKSDYVASKEALVIDERTPEIKKLVFSDMVCEDAQYTGAYVYGLPERKIECLEMQNIKITYADQAQYGIAAMMRDSVSTSRQGIFVRNVKKLILTNVHTIGAEQEFDIQLVDEIGGGKE